MLMNTVRRSRTAHLAGVAVLALLLAGCRGSRPAPADEGPLPVRLSIAGTSDLNSAASENGAAQSVRVRVYELTEDASFRTVTLETFWRDEAAALAGELVGSQQVLLYPGATETVEIQPGPSTRFIGVAANFRLPDPQHWRQVYPVESLRGRTVHVVVGADRVAADVR